MKSHAILFALCSMCNTGGSTHSLLPAAYVFIGLTLGFIFLGCKSGKSYFLRSSGIPVLLAKVSSNPRRHSTATNPFSIRYYSKAKITLVWNEGSQIGIFGSFSALIDCFSCYWAKYILLSTLFSASCLENWLNFTLFFGTVMTIWTKFSMFYLQMICTQRQSNVTFL